MEDKHHHHSSKKKSHHHHSHHHNHKHSKKDHDELNYGGRVDKHKNKHNFSGKRGVP